MSIAPLTFTGVSTYSTDFQSILSRALSIAQLPIKALQGDQQTVLAKQSAFGNLSAAVGYLATKLEQLGSNLSGQALAANTSRYDLAQIAISDASEAHSGEYIVSDITAMAEAGIYNTGVSYTDKDNTAVAGGSHYLQLVVGAETHDIQLSAETDNLADVRDAINALNAGVNATIISTSPSTHYLSITATQTGAKNIELRTTKDTPATDLLGVVRPGADAQFKLNGQAVTSATNSISDAIPGVTITLTGLTSGAEKAALKISRTQQGAAQSLREIVEAYNAAQAEVEKHVGKAGGDLAGESVLRGVQSALRGIPGWSFATGSFTSLSDLGISIDNDGVMTFDSSALESVDEAQLKDLFAALGSGAGGFATLSASLKTFSDAATGLIHEQQEALTKRDQALAKQIDTLTERINDTQTALMARLQSADVLLAKLQSQQGLLDASIKSLNLTMYGKNEQ